MKNNLTLSLYLPSDNIIWRLQTLRVIWRNTGDRRISTCMWLKWIQSVQVGSFCVSAEFRVTCFLLLAYVVLTHTRRLWSWRNLWDMARIVLYAWPLITNTESHAIRKPQVTWIYQKDCLWPAVQAFLCTVWYILLTTFGSNWLPQVTILFPLKHLY